MPCMIKDSFILISNSFDLKSEYLREEKTEEEKPTEKGNQQEEDHSAFPIPC